MIQTYGFPMMADIIPETPKEQRPPNGGSGFFIAHQVLDQKRVEHECAMASIRRDWTCRGLEAGTYCVLHEVRNGHVDEWMSDTWLERSTNREILQDGKGNVLLAGLGIGMVAAALCQKEEVDSVTVLEIEPQVIALVEPHIRHPKLTVLLSDAHRPPFTGRFFDTVYIDIWINICSDNWEPMKSLLRQYRKFARKGAVVTAWLKDYIQESAREDRGKWGAW